MNNSLKLALIGLTAGLILVVGGWWLVNLLRPYNFHGTVLQSPDAAPNFTLQSAKGDVSLSDFRGKLVILYFGYTFCPDVCPASMSAVAGGLDLIGKKAERVQVMMISVDPERDTPAEIDAYAKHFNPNFIGVTGSPEEIAQIATLYGIYYAKAEGSAASGYLVEHTATLMVIDEQGALKLLLPFGVTAEDIAADLNYMLR
ncbi:MAG: SCO family protein [Anaerolineales bacterium]